MRLVRKSKGNIMKYDSSNYGNGGSNSRRQDAVPELQPALQPVAEVSKTPSAARNWAWAHNTESYDWMDSHSLFSTEETFH
jgi:hypothetical protein